MSRPLLTLLLTPLPAACGVFGLSSEEAANLARYQRNSALYYEGGEFERALDQVRRGLEIDPDDYKLHVTGAWCMLRQSQSDPRKLPVATAAFDRLMAMRSEGDHSPQARLGYGTAHGKLGVELLSQAQTARSEAARLQLDGAELAAQEASAADLEKRSEHEFDLAEAELRRLLDSGDWQLEAHYHLMYVSVWRGDHQAAIDHGNRYLERTGKLQANLRKELEQTVQLEFERFLRIRLQSRLDEEVEVRAFLANLHFKAGHHELVVQQLDAVLLENPTRYYEYYNRGRSLQALGRGADAKRDYERFLYSTDLPREHPQVQAALAAIKELE